MTALRQLFTSPSQKREAQELYIALVHQSRKPFFYTDCGVPDTLDGRFDVILLHVFMTLYHLKSDAHPHGELSRLLLECFFDDMDRSLREMGVGDMGVGKRVKTMSKAAYGRLEAYTAAFKDEVALQEALLRNMYRGVEVKPAMLSVIMEYIRHYNSYALVQTKA